MVAIMSVADSKPSGLRPVTKTRLFLLTALAALVILCFAYSWFASFFPVKPANQATTACTQPANNKKQSDNKKTADSKKTIKNKPQSAIKLSVSTQPWQTAHSLATTVTTTKEAVSARQAEQLADHEVDQAFDAALRCAELRKYPRYYPKTVCSEFLKDIQSSSNLGKNQLNDEITLSTQRVQQLQQDIAQDTMDIARLKKGTSTTTDSDDTAIKAEDGNNSLQIAKFKKDIDSDELKDAQFNLNRAKGNFINSIQDQFKGYQDSIKKFDNELNNNTPLPIHPINNSVTLIASFHIWWNQHHRLRALKQAQKNTEAKVCNLCSQKTPLNTFIGNADLPPPTANSQTQPQKNLRRLGYIYTDRYNTNKKLAQTYAGWITQVRRQNRLLQGHLLQSVGTILAVILWILILDSILYRLTDRPSLTRRKVQTLRAVLKVGIQLIGVMVILLLIFGPPNETGTIIGLITAALALALQDYILAFFGWFMLAGPRGIKVGDMVEIDGICGEVEDIGLLRTNLLETTGLREKGEPTGRHVSLLNSYAVHGACFKFPSEGQWLWDEITITVPADADIYKIAKSVEKLATDETKESARLAEQDWNLDMPANSLNRISAKPIVMMWPSISLDISTSIDIQVRFVTSAVGRYEVRDRLYKHVLQLLKDQGHPNPQPPTNPSSS